MEPGRAPQLALAVLFLLLACGLSCRRNDNPQAAYDHAYQALVHGDLKQAQDEAHRECQRFRDSSPDWAWRFRTLEARAELQRGLYEDALKLLNSAPLPTGHPDLAIPVLTLAGEAYVNIHNFPAAKRSLDDAAKLCAASEWVSCGYVLKARGLLATEQNQTAAADRLFELSLAFARSHRDALLESYALLNLGYDSLAEGRFDEATDRSEDAYEAAKALGAQRLEIIALYNIGWAYYNLGDSDRALELSEQTENLASQLGDVRDQENILTNIGYIYLDARRYGLAEQSFQQALGLAQKISAKEDIYNALRVLARLSLQTGDLDKATQYAQQALDIARHDNIHLDELYPMLVQGQIAARRGNSVEANATFQQVERDPLCPPYLKWEAEHSLARLYEDEKPSDAAHQNAADREYRAALTTFAAARDTVRHEDSQLSFLTNAARIYDDYVHFLVARGQPGDALRWADYSRARTLAEGLGVLRKRAPAGTGAEASPLNLPRNSALNPPPLNPQQIARRAAGAVLFYWLGEKQSYLWAITPQKVALFPLPPGAEIDAAVARYRQSLAGPQDVLASADPDGRWLYRTLVAPARSALKLKKDAKVFIIPDGALNNLNFETLLVSEKASETAPENAPNRVPENASETKAHYWIEDVTIANASSLRVLAAARPSEPVRAMKTIKAASPAANQAKRTLLLVGNSVAPTPQYPELPKAAAQMESVARHFPPAHQRRLERDQATPAAFLASHPEQFSYIHFVAHGTASRLSPLDSAIILSKEALSKAALSKEGPKEASKEAALAEEKFKLHAREIVAYSRTNPLRADLVTISACYGAGERAYSGEGLVGLSWAFLRAGAHNVVAALWEATDTSTEQLMDKFYDEMDSGAAPDAALRTAKLALLRESGFRNPFYWAPFQLYTGS